MLILYERTITYTSHPTKFKKIFQRLVDKFYQESFSEIKQPSSKLRTYSILKTEKGFENYLYEIKNLKHRIMMTTLRLSDHKLMIETGRHKNIIKELRFCPFCPGEVEDEIHFILKCRPYAQYRNPSWRCSNHNKLNRFKTIMTSVNSLEDVARFIELAFTTRSNLLINQN